MPRIVLATLNARYIHASFGLRYLHANLGPLAAEAAILEFEARQDTLSIVERILAAAPRIIGFGVYIWNVAETRRVVDLIKRIAPETVIVVGGPEVSHELENEPLARSADYVITGEADHAFRKLCESLDAGAPPESKIIRSRLPTLTETAQPYDYYTDADIAHRVLYVEASRGCPFTCEFCLSSLDIPVRAFELEPFLAEMEKLLARGAKQFKFVDRTFNLNLRTSRAILEFFLERYVPGMFLHFEMVPDRLPAGIREIITRFPPGVLQFEVGIQSFNPEVGSLISRRQDVARIEENFAFLRSETGVHIHADLIIGLPGESVESFAEGFDRLVRLGPQEIQVGVLKRLKGTPIARHTAEWEMVYDPEPPYEIISNRLIPFQLMQRLKRFSRYWDLTANSGNFVQSTPLIWSGSGRPFDSFLRFSDNLFAALGTRSGIALERLAEALFRYLVDEGGIPERVAGRSIATDYLGSGDRSVPNFLRPYATPPSRRSEALEIPKRQRRMLRSSPGQRALNRLEIGEHGSASPAVNDSDGPSHARSTESSLTERSETSPIVT